MATTMDPRHRIAYNIVFYALAMIFLVLRFGQRLTPASIRRIRENPSVPALLADFFMFFALVLINIAIGLDIWLQRRIIYLSSNPALLIELIQVYSTGMKLMFANLFFWVLVMWSVKAALMALYYDIANHITPRVKHLMNITSVVLVLTILALIITFFSWCQPLSKNWTITNNMCSPQTHSFPVVSTSVLHIITDILVLGIPLLILRTLNLQRAQIIAVNFIYGIGLLAFSVSLVSLALQIQIVSIKAQSVSYLSDMEVKSERVYLAAIAECSIAIVGACLPSLRVFLRMLFKSKSVSDKTKNTRGLKETSSVSGLGTGRRSVGGSSWSAAPRMKRWEKINVSGGSAFDTSRSDSPALELKSRLVEAQRVGDDPQVSPSTLTSMRRETLKRPLKAMASPSLNRSHVRASVCQTDIAPALQAQDITTPLRNFSSVDSLLLVDHSQHTQPSLDTPLGGSDHGSEFDAEPQLLKPPGVVYSHHRTWSGCEAPLPTPLSPHPRYQSPSTAE